MTPTFEEYFENVKTKKMINDYINEKNKSDRFDDLVSSTNGWIGLSFSIELLMLLLSISLLKNDTLTWAMGTLTTISLILFLHCYFKTEYYFKKLNKMLCELITMINIKSKCDIEYLKDIIEINEKEIENKIHFYTEQYEKSSDEEKSLKALINEYHYLLKVNKVLNNMQSHYEKKTINIIENRI